jgi:hypothetical protein
MGPPLYFSSPRHSYGETARPWSKTCTKFQQSNYHGDLEALAGALGLLRDGKFSDLSARIKAHLEDPETCVVLANNPRFSERSGSKRCVRIANPATSDGSAPVVSTSTANDPFPPQMPSFSQTQEYQPSPYSNHSSNYNTGSSSFHFPRRVPPAIHTSTSDSLQSVVPSNSMNLNNYNLNFYGNLR